MRRPLKTAGVFVVMAAALAAPPPDDPAEAERKNAARIRAAIKQLGDDDYRKREEASKHLREIGEPALPDLREAAAGPDPEVRERARWLVLAIMQDAGKSKSTGMELNPVLSNEFLMGSPKGEFARQPDEALHRVVITKSFLIGRYEVTQDEYQKVMNLNPSWHAPTGGGKDKVRGMDAGRFPVEQVSWYDALDFCNRLSELDGFKPYYKLTDFKREKDSITSATVTVLGGNGYRLPTEAEWEFACRGGIDNTFHFGRRSSGSRDANMKVVVSAGYGGTDVYHLQRAARVGGYKANRRGLFDMHGNVGEWCWDWYDRDYYDNSPVADPPGPEKGTHKVTRGGSWLLSQDSCRSASRGLLPPGEANYAIGFRVARTP